MVMDGVENPDFESKNEGGENSGVTTRLENDGKNLPKSNSKFTSSVLLKKHLQDDWWTFSCQPSYESCVQAKTTPS